MTSLLEFCRCRFNGCHTAVMVTRGEHEVVLRSHTGNEQIPLINAKELPTFAMYQFLW